MRDIQIEWACEIVVFRDYVDISLPDYIPLRCAAMDASSEQPAAIAAEPVVSSNEQEHNDEAMEETEEYSYEGDDYRHFMPRGRGGFRCV